MENNGKSAKERWLSPPLSPSPSHVSYLLSHQKNPSHYWQDDADLPAVIAVIVGIQLNLNSTSLTITRKTKAFYLQNSYQIKIKTSIVLCKEDPLENLKKV